MREIKGFQVPKYTPGPSKFLTVGVCQLQNTPKGTREERDLVQWGR